MTKAPPKALEDLRVLLECSAVHRPPEVVLRTSLNEAWFSDTLAWLLDPSGSHGLGPAFAKRFLTALARNRRSGSGGEYAQAATHLAYGKGPHRKGADSKKRERQRVSSLKLANAAVLREFHLSADIGRGAEHGRYCDVVLLDLDTSDSLFVAIENKLFTVNHPGQLARYWKVVHTRYSRAATREYAYLTLLGTPPVGDERCRKHWVRMGWLTDVHDALQKARSRRRVDARVDEVLGLLVWLRSLFGVSDSEESAVQIDAAARVDLVDAFARSVLLASSRCLHEELDRLGGGDLFRLVGEKYEESKGPWGAPPKGPLKDGTQTVFLQHGRTFAQRLHVQLLPSCSVMLQARHKQGKEKAEKILVPFGAHPDQVFHLLDIAARDTYYAKFADPRAKYLADRRRLRKTRSLRKEQHRSLFRFLHEHRFELKVLFGALPLLRAVES